VFRRPLVATALALSLSVTAAGSVLAHECVISSRSDRGDAGALNSKVWGQHSLAFILGFIHEIVGSDPLTPSQIQWAVANRGTLPLAWTVRIDKTIGEGSSSPNLADGRGLDHLSALAGQQVVALYFAALSH
jgi:hypothetical protein